MREVFQAVYDALINDSGIREFVPESQIRRGWQEPVDVVSLRFFSRGSSAIGDDLGREELITANFDISILHENDLTLETIAKLVVATMKAESLQNANIIFHNCIYIGDNRGAFLDPIRKRHRKDLSFRIVYSPATR